MTTEQNKPTPRPMYKPLRPGARIFWTLVTLASFGFAIHAYASALGVI